LDANLPKADSFRAVTPYYDELMKQVPYRMWVGYYLLLLSQQNKLPKRMLDICCGTGTMTEMLHEEGFRMAGFDLAPGMISEAIRKALSKNYDIRYEVFDAAEAAMGEQYEAAYSFFDSLNNIIEPERLQMAFHRAAEHLEPGGSFIFDMNTAYAFEQRMFDQKQLRSNAKIKYKWEGSWDPETRLISVDMKFWYGKQEFHETHVQRAYEFEDIWGMLEEAGFEQIRAYHSYTLNPPRHTSDRLHWTAIKP
jgi:ubiquinone/menaquinone biosynthesis C-methylase UbiE